ncbi:phosphatase PAP2 family protein [Paeniglutamicibacter terrestris]|uniref:Phosphatase PAP2 family protein n=1 Tax=Paeniglutamicibacter terrestris TaxID=2723403 RepID=A0ABX1G8S5_9MICC|nr:phosphatase PAP2 family protein [Paeniglutamicibacter terrestris]ASN40576.1 phosphoesterase [Arthrobacter sp. 7749]NKG22663.1 phosphatase PAP2 family protein [Paeniglutamicibacter terrestris]
MSSSRRPAKNGQRAGSILIFCLALVLGLFAVARRLWVSVAAGGVPHEWDIPLLEWMESHRTPFATIVAWVFSSVGDTLGMSILSLCVIGLFFWRTHSLWPGALIALTAAGSVTLTVVLKNIWGRARPPLDDALLPVPASYSFPSGHTLNSVAILGVIGYLAFLILRSQWARVVALSSLGCLAVGVGWSRIYLGHHWLTDVVGGLLIGGCWAAVVIIMHHFVLVKNRRTVAWLRL